MQMNHSMVCMLHSGFCFLSVFSGCISYLKYGRLDVQAPSGIIFTHGLIVASVTCAGCGNGYLNALQLASVVLMLPGLVLRCLDMHWFSRVLTEYVVTILFAGAFLIMWVIALFCADVDFFGQEESAQAVDNTVAFFGLAGVLFMVWQLLRCAGKLKTVKAQ